MNERKLRDPGAVTDASPEIRVSDAERQRVVDRLRDETAAGRLTLDEFDERVGEALAARTRADLMRCLRELPDPAIEVSALADEPPDLERRARRRHWTSVRNEAAGFVSANGICIGIWTAAGADGHFWPIWILIPTGIGLVEKVLRGPERERRALRNEWKKDRRKALKRAQQQLPD